MGELTAPDDLDVRAEESGFLPLPVTWPHAWLAGALPPLHDDPSDRTIVAQATLESLTIVTADRRIPAYGVGSSTPWRSRA